MRVADDLLAQFYIDFVSSGLVRNDSKRTALCTLCKMATAKRFEV